MVTVTMAITDALFALFVAATTFSLGLRAYETERLVAELRAWMPGGAAGATGAVLGLLGLCALALDAFEIIFVVIPVVLPPPED